MTARSAPLLTQTPPSSSRDALRRCTSPAKRRQTPRRAVTACQPLVVYPMARKFPIKGLAPPLCLAALVLTGCGAHRGAASVPGEAAAPAAPATKATSAAAPLAAATPGYPRSMAVLGHSNATGEDSDPAQPHAVIRANSWATGTNPAVNSVYLRILANNPAIKSHDFNLAQPSATVDDLPPGLTRSSTATRRSSQSAASASPVHLRPGGIRAPGGQERVHLRRPQPLLGPGRGRGRGGGLGGDEPARSDPPMTHPGTQCLPTPIHHRRGCNLTGHGLPRRPARPPRWPRGRAPVPPGISAPGVSAAPHSRYRPLTRGVPAGDGAAAPPAHGRHAAGHAAEPAPAPAR